MKRRIFMVLIGLLISLSAGAEDIVLKNGMTVQGRILERSNKWVKVLASNVEVTYYYDEIQQIDGKIPEPLIPAQILDSQASDNVGVKDTVPVVSAEDNAGNIVQPEADIKPLEESAARMTSEDKRTQQNSAADFEDNRGVKSKVRQAPAMVQIFVIIAIAILIAVVFLFCYPVYLIAQKTHADNPVFAFIPILNFYLVCKIAGRPVWWMILYLIPVVNLVIDVIVWVDIAKRRNKPAWLGMLTVVPLVNVGMMWYLAVAE